MEGARSGRCFGANWGHDFNFGFWNSAVMFPLRVGFSKAAAGLWLAISSIALGADWPRFLGPNADGTSPETELLDSWPAAGPPKVWSRAVGTGYSAPSVLGNRLVVHHRVEDEEIVECLDAGNGATLWKYAYPSRFIDPYGYNNGPRSSPWLTTNRCYTFGAEGKLLCLNLATGEKIWERDTAREWDIPEAFFGVGSSPILEGGRLLVMVGGQPNAGMVAFDPETGRTLWESVGRKNWEGQPMIGWPGERAVVWRPFEKQASYATPVAATIHGQRRVLCLMRQGLVSLNPEDGSVDFSFWFRARVDESVNAANPVVSENKVFISAAYYRVGSVLLDVKPNGSVDESWRSTVLEIHWTTPILHNGYLYAFSGRNEPDARFRCVELATGKLMWERNEGWRRFGEAPKTYGRGSAILADGKLIVLGEAGRLGLFRAESERPVEISAFQVPELRYPCWAGPVLSQKMLYLRSEDQLICLDLTRR
jgi:outer membrane protein assembly factor BamB